MEFLIFFLMLLTCLKSILLLRHLVSNTIRYPRVVGPKDKELTKSPYVCISGHIFL